MVAFAASGRGDVCDRIDIPDRQVRAISWLMHPTSDVRGLHSFDHLVGGGEQCAAWRWVVYRHDGRHRISEPLLDLCVSDDLEPEPEPED